MAEINFKAIIKERGFPLSMRHFGRIVDLTDHRLRGIYREDQARFYRLLDVAIERWESICKGVRDERD